MARAHNVYIALLSNRPVAAFTVKHECRTWLHKKWGGRCPSNLEVLRMRDGADDKPVTVTLHLFDFPKHKDT